MLPPRLPKKPRREKAIRSPGHRAWVRSHACCVTGCPETQIEAAHVRTETDGGVGLKPGDNWCLSLCKIHHEQQHTLGERKFSEWFRIDMKALAAEFWAKSPHRRKHAA